MACIIEFSDAVAWRDSKLEELQRTITRQLELIDGMRERVAELEANLGGQGACADRPRRRLPTS